VLAELTQLSVTQKYVDAAVRQLWMGIVDDLLRMALPRYDDEQVGLRKCYDLDVRYQ
jgi:hypothetical protein